jgi:hypothetical protein
VYIWNAIEMAETENRTNIAENRNIKVARVGVGKKLNSQSVKVRDALKESSQISYTILHRFGIIFVVLKSLTGLNFLVMDHLPHFIREDGEAGR